MLPTHICTCTYFTAETEALSSGDFTSAWGILRVLCYEELVSNLPVTEESRLQQLGKPRVTSSLILPMAPTPATGVPSHDIPIKFVQVLQASGRSNRTTLGLRDALEVGGALPILSRNDPHKVPGWPKLFFDSGPNGEFPPLGGGGEGDLEGRL